MNEIDFSEIENITCSVPRMDRMHQRRLPTCMTGT